MSQGRRLIAAGCGVAFLMAGASDGARAAALPVAMPALSMPASVGVTAVRYVRRAPVRRRVVRRDRNGRIIAGAALGILGAAAAAAAADSYYDRPYYGGGPGYYGGGPYYRYRGGYGPYYGY